MKNEAFFVFTINSESLSFSRKLHMKLAKFEICVLQRKHDRSENSSLNQSKLCIDVKIQNFFGSFRKSMMKRRVLIFVKLFFIALIECWGMKRSQKPFLPKQSI